MLPRSATATVTPENDETWCPSKKGCAEYLSDYDHASIPVTVSSGDSGYDDSGGAPSWPATSPNVIAVGGTALNKASNTRGWSEAVWSDSGSGCSLYETKPSWQIDKGCAKRMDNDVSAVASPSTPVSVYNTPMSSGWVNVGGTSVASPLIAGIEAHATSTTRSAGAEAFYKHPGMLFDVTTGSNGSCSGEHAYECKGEVGYDGPTGWGTPNGVPRLTGWFTRVVPNLATKINAKNNVLSSSSCLESICFAVGHTTNVAGTEVPLAEVWNGTAWAIQEISPPTGAKGSSLSSVSCQSGLVLDLCMAVGHYTNSSGTEVALDEIWDGSEWISQSPPDPSEAKGSSLLSVSCASTESCWAVGRYITAGGAEQTLTEKWSKGTWSIVESPNPTGAKDSVMSAVSCSLVGSEEGCVAVGHYINSSSVEVTLGERWVKFLAKWEILTTPNPTGAKGSSLIGLSCTEGLSCSAVGRYINSSGTEVTLVEHTSAEITIQESPNPTGAKSSSLTGLACFGGTSETCKAVGHYVNSSGTEVTLAETYASGKWTVQETPNPTGAKSSNLIGVRCTSSEACTALGRYVSSSGGELTLAETFASSKWTVQETPNPKIPTGNFSAVSCSASEVCTAVGHYANESGTELTLAEGWNGKEWSFQEPSTPTGAKGSSLTGVSCASTTVCMAVGRYVNSAGTEVTLAEEYASSKWTIKEPSTPTGAKGSSLTGVSCASTTVCMAVGRYVNSAGTEVTLAEEYASSKWTIKEPSNPTGAKGSVLSGLSCSSSEACTAVGHYINSSGAELTLAETYASSKWTIGETPNPEEVKSSLSSVSCKTAEACIATGRVLGSTESDLVEEYA